MMSVSGNPLKLAIWDFSLTGSSQVQKKIVNGLTGFPTAPIFLLDIFMRPGQLKNQS